MLFRYEETAHVTNQELSAEAPNLEPYVERLNKVAKADNYMYEERMYFSKDVRNMFFIVISTGNHQCTCILCQISIWQ